MISKRKILITAEQCALINSFIFMKKKKKKEFRLKQKKKVASLIIIFFLGKIEFIEKKKLVSYQFPLSIFNFLVVFFHDFFKLLSFFALLLLKNY